MSGEAQFWNKLYPPFVTTYHPMAGWKAVQMVWVDYGNGEGQYEPWQTGICGYRDRNDAIAEAESWAEVEGIAYRD